ncbi:beta-propeller fold lactonase family protein [Janibacter cremeus]|uniref:YVTN family beta-propeller protein n=1 Tax=Janibacter cremeus TaxID=1285192 RepID=A0A852VQU7_9MICO|nr:YVTN family beta-propeller protein [Janibacter cremeus]
MKIKNDPIYVRRRRIVLAVVVAIAVVLVLLVGSLVVGTEGEPSAEAASSTSTAAEPTQPTEVESPAPEDSPATPQGESAAAAETDLVRVQRLTGEMAPKSVVASAKGQIFAQNMMYRHTVSVFTADGALQKTIDDSVELADFGIEGHPGTSKGAPVEMAFSPDGETAWVSNYSMYGENFLPEGKDACAGPKGVSDSYVYKIDTSSLEIVDVIEVGAVPKYVAATPDGKQVLVSNWCSMDLSVIDVEQGEVTSTIPLGGDNPRGIEVSPDSSTAYVALMGSDRTVSVELASGEVDADFTDTGDGPRHLVLSPEGEHLYVTNNNSGTVSEVDAATGEVTREVAVGTQPRSMAMSPDGGALYVVNYNDATMSKVATEDFEVIQTVKTDPHPIGITYEPTEQRVWVANYGGSIIVFDDSRTVD